VSFSEIESSLAFGEPVRLYLFSRASQNWGFNSSDRDIEFEGVLYKSEAITDTGERQTGQPDAQSFEVTVPADNPVAQLYRGAAPSAEVMLTVRDMHFADQDPLVAWIGSIFSVRWPALDRAKITCESLAATLQNPGLRLSWSLNCPHALYGRGCLVEKDNFRFAGTISSLDGVTLEIPELADQEDGFFTGGFIEWSIGPALVERRTVEAHTGTSARLLGGTAGLTAGTAVDMFPGCPRTAQVCNDRFDNLDNYGGHPHLPGRSPFDGNPVF